MGKKKEKVNVIDLIHNNLISRKLNADMHGIACVTDLASVSDGRQARRLERELIELGVAHVHPKGVEIDAAIYRFIKSEPIDFEGDEWHDPSTDLRYCVSEHHGCPGLRWEPLNNSQKLWIQENAQDFRARWVYWGTFGPEFVPGGAWESWREYTAKHSSQPSLVVYTPAWEERERRIRFQGRVADLMTANFEWALHTSGLASEVEAKSLRHGFREFGEGNRFGSTRSEPDAWADNLDYGIKTLRETIVECAKRLAVMERIKGTVEARGGWDKILDPLYDQLAEHLHARDAAEAIGMAEEFDRAQTEAELYGEDN